MRVLLRTSFKTGSTSTAGPWCGLRRPRSLGAFPGAHDTMPSTSVSSDYGFTIIGLPSIPKLVVFRSYPIVDSAYVFDWSRLSEKCSPSFIDILHAGHFGYRAATVGVRCRARLGDNDKLEQRHHGRETVSATHPTSRATKNDVSSADADLFHLFV